MTRRRILTWALVVLALFAWFAVVTDEGVSRNEAEWARGFGR